MADISAKTTSAKEAIQQYAYDKTGRLEINALTLEIGSLLSDVQTHIDSLKSLEQRSVPNYTPLTDMTGYTGEPIVMQEGRTISSSVATPFANQEANLVISGTVVTVPKKAIELVVDSRFSVTFFITYYEGAVEETVQVNSSSLGIDSSADPTLYGAQYAQTGDVITITFDDTVTTIYVIPSRGVKSLNNTLNTTTFNQSHFLASDLARVTKGSILTHSEVKLVTFNQGVVTSNVPSRCVLTDGVHEYACIDTQLTLIKGYQKAMDLTDGEYTVRTESVSFTTDVTAYHTDVVKEKEEGSVVNTNLDKGDIIYSDKERAEVTRTGLGARATFIKDPKGFTFSSRSRIKRALSLIEQEVPSLPADVHTRESEVYEALIAVESYIDEVLVAMQQIASLTVEYPIIIEINRMHRRVGYDRAADLLSTIDIDAYLALEEHEASYDSFLADTTKTLQVKVME